MQNNKISPGDNVCVNFNGSCYTLTGDGTVVYVPTCVGDNWIISDNRTKELHYVSEPCTVTKLMKVEKEDIPF